MLFTFAYCCAAPDYSVGSGVGLVVLDDCNFHESVRLDDFETERALTLVGPLVHSMHVLIDLTNLHTAALESPYNDYASSSSFSFLCSRYLRLYGCRFHPKASSQ